MSPDEQAIRSLVSTWLTASKSGDLPTLHSLMAVDILFMVPSKEPFGKEAFTPASAAAMKEMKLDAHHTIKEIQILGNTAWMRSHLKITMTPPNSAPITKSGYILTIFQKKPDGHWVIHRDANLLA